MKKKTVTIKTWMAKMHERENAILKASGFPQAQVKCRLRKKAMSTARADWDNGHGAHITLNWSGGEISACQIITQPNEAAWIQSFLKGLANSELLEVFIVARPIHTNNPAKP